MFVVGENTLVYSALLPIKNLSKIYLVMCLIVIDFHTELILDERKYVPYVLLTMYQTPCLTPYIYYLILFSALKGRTNIIQTVILTNKIHLLISKSSSSSSI